MSLILWQCWSHCCLPFFRHFVNWFSQKFNGRLVHPECLFRFWLFADFAPASKSCHFLPGAENFLWFIAKKQLIFFFKMVPRRSLYDELFSNYDFLKLFIFPFFCIWSRQYFSLIVEPRLNRIADERNFP